MRNPDFDLQQAISEAEERASNLDASGGIWPVARMTSASCGGDADDDGEPALELRLEVL